MALKRCIIRITNDPDNVKFGYAKPQIFNKDQEAMLVRYLKRSADIIFGLGSKDVHRLACD